MRPLALPASPPAPAHCRSEGRARPPGAPERLSRTPGWAGSPIRPPWTLLRPLESSLLALLAASVLPLTPLRADPPPPSPAAAPYLQLRTATLGYHGAADDLAGLTEIRIGWFAPSDPADPVHGDFWWAASLAVEEANAQRPAGDPAAFAALPVRLVPRWTADPWGSGVSLLARMVYDEQPLALLGSIDSASTHLAEQVVAKANLPLVSPIATDKTVTLAGVSWMFACAPDDTAIARALVADLLRRVAARPESAISDRKFPLIVLATTDHASRLTARELARELARRGLAPQFRFDLPPGGGELDAPLRTAAAGHPSAVIVIADAADSARLVRAVRDRLGAAIPIFGGQAVGRLRFAELAGAAAEGVRFPVLFAPDPSDPAAAAFAARFAAARHRAPDYTAALAYDATRLLVAAIRRAGPNRARVREALVQLSPWPGIAGPIAFDGTGQSHRAGVRLGTIRAGAVVADAAPAALAAGFVRSSSP